MVEYPLAISKKSKFVVLWRFEGKLITSGYKAPQYQQVTNNQIDISSKDYIPSRLAQNVEYLAVSAASSITTSNRFPLLLRPCTRPRSNSTTKGKSPRISMAVTLIFSETLGHATFWTLRSLPRGRQDSKAPAGYADVCRPLDGISPLFTPKTRLLNEIHLLFLIL